MMKRFLFLLALILFILVGCRQDSEAEVVSQGEDAVATATAVVPTATVVMETAVPPAVDPTATAAPAIVTDGIYISELMLGLSGRNSYEYIELYNAGTQPFDLQGFSLLYQLDGSQEEKTVYSWERETVVPPLGHYLLAREGQDVGVVPDATFDVSLFERKGIVSLKLDDVYHDWAGWGDVAGDIPNLGSSAPIPTDERSLERLPGGALGNGQKVRDDDVGALWVQATPNPQNSGDLPTPLPDNYVSINVVVPDSVTPGAEFRYEVTVINESETAVTDVRVVIPVPDHLAIMDLPEGSEVADGLFQWQLAGMAAGAAANTQFTVQAPFTYLDTPVQGYYVETAETIRGYGPLRNVATSGGAIPIAIARDLIDAEVSIEGIATMYTGGFFAGSSGVKFYIEDETGGVQVYVPDGQGAVGINIGDRVRVTGGIEIYRNSVELVPIDNDVDIEVIAREDGEVTPTAITAVANESDDTVLGRLNVLEGTAIRIEEFSFSYEMDLLDAEGNTTLVYIEKDTGITAEPLSVDKQYRVTGISEYYSGERQIKPRVQRDIVEIFPPVLLVTQQTANNVQVGEMLTYTITVYNHTPDVMTNVTVNALMPTDGVSSEVDERVWMLESLPGLGSSATFSYTVEVLDSDAELIMAPAVTAVADQWEVAAESQVYLTFLGDRVPIWAIQGTGMASPYAGSDVTTRGLVTGVYPDLSGFWMQEVESDDDPTTSAGVFVLLAQNSPWLVGDEPLRSGDDVRVTGRVREISGQTTLFPETAVAVELLGSNNFLPAAVFYDPPADPTEALLYNESLEGTWVEIGEEGALVVAPTTRFGEYVMVRDKWGVDSVSRLDDVGYLIYADDGSSVAHEDQTTIPDGGAIVQRGDRVFVLAGPLAYTFGNYKIEPLTYPFIEPAEELPLPSLPLLADNQFSVATFNVENFFDLTDPHPNSPPRPTLSEYRLKTERIAAAIEAMGAPAIVGMQEVENLGLLENVAEEPILANYQYEAYLIEGTDSRGIDNGYLVRRDLVTVEGVGSYDASEGLTSRPPLVLTATVSLNGEPTRLFVLNNHFTSLAAGEEATEPRRTAQAAWNVTVLNQLWSESPDAEVVVMGDLNSFYGTLPMQQLEEAGLIHVYDSFGDNPFPYTYIFNGRTQTLDHIFVSEGLFAQLDLVEALHINADFPVVDWETGAIPQRVSDHDPLVARFAWP